MLRYILLLINTNIALLTTSGWVYGTYHISRNECTGQRGTNKYEALSMSDSNETNCELRNTSTLSFENLIEISSVVSEI